MQCTCLRQTALVGWFHSVGHIIQREFWPTGRKVSTGRQQRTTSC